MPGSASVGEHATGVDGIPPSATCLKDRSTDRDLLIQTERNSNALSHTRFLTFPAVVHGIVGRVNSLKELADKKFFNETNRFSGFEH